MLTFPDFHGFLSEEMIQLNARSTQVMRSRILTETNDRLLDRVLGDLQNACKESSMWEPNPTSEVGPIPFNTATLGKS